MMKSGVKFVGKLADMCRNKECCNFLLPRVKDQFWWLFHSLQGQTSPEKHAEEISFFDLWPAYNAISLVFSDIAS